MWAFETITNHRFGAVKQPMEPAGGIQKLAYTKPAESIVFQIKTYTKNKEHRTTLTPYESNKKTFNKKLRLSKSISYGK